MKKNILAIVMACVLMLGFSATVYPPSLSVSAASEVSMECCDEMASRSMAPQNECHVNGGSGWSFPIRRCCIMPCGSSCLHMLFSVLSCNC